MLIDRTVAVGGVIVGLVGTGIVVLWPEKRWLGWVFIGLGLVIALISIVWTLAVSHARREFNQSHSKFAAMPIPSPQLISTGIDFKPHIEVKPTFNQTQTPSPEQSQRQRDLARFKNTKLNFSMPIGRIRRCSDIRINSRNLA